MSMLVVMICINHNKVCLINSGAQVSKTGNHSSVTASYAPSVKLCYKARADRTGAAILQLPNHDVAARVGEGRGGSLSCLHMALCGQP